MDVVDKAQKTTSNEEQATQNDNPNEETSGYGQSEAETPDEGTCYRSHLLIGECLKYILARKYRVLTSLVVLSN